MNIVFSQCIRLLAIGALFFSVAGCTEQQQKQRPTVGSVEQYQKAITLAQVACSAYPSISDLNVCADVVSRGILEHRQVPKEEALLVLEELDAQILANSTTPGASTKGAFSPQDLALKIISIVTYSCTAVKPPITDITACMDSAYHGIMSSRDPHSTYFNEEELEEFRKVSKGQLEGIGANVGWTDEKSVGIIHVMEGSPAEKAGILEGDRIITIINGGERMATSSFPNIGEAIKKIRGKPGSVVSFDILRGESGTPISITVKRGAVRVPMIKAEIVNVPDNPTVTYAYIQVTQFGENIRENVARKVDEMIRQRPKVSGIIFDLRGNPGGLLNQVYEMADLFLDSSESLVSIRDSHGIHALNSDGTILFPQPGDITNGLPIGILIDTHSASAAEIFPGIMKMYGRAVIIGMPTWQKGTVQTVEPFDAVSAVKRTRSEYLIGSPNSWVAVQCVGVTPDIEYEAVGRFKPKKEMHECDLPGAVVSGGRTSHPDKVEAPLRERNPALYEHGLGMLSAVKVLDVKNQTKFDGLRKKLGIRDKPKEESEKNEKK